MPLRYDENEQATMCIMRKFQSYNISHPLLRTGNENVPRWLINRTTRAAYLRYYRQTTRRKKKTSKEKVSKLRADNGRSEGVKRKHGSVYRRQGNLEAGCLRARTRPLQKRKQ